MDLQDIKPRIYHLVVNEKSSCFSGCFSLNTISAVDRAQQESAFCALLLLKSSWNFGRKLLPMSS